MSDVLKWSQKLDDDVRRISAQHAINKPFFGVFTMGTGRRDVEYRLGEQNIPSEYIIDWRHPLASAYYQQTGQVFSSEGGRYVKVSGTILRKAAVEIERRTITQCIVQTLEGTERVVSGPNGFEHAQGASASSEGGLGELRALLTETQHRLVVTSRQRPLIVRGRAGSGKTSVALHRVAQLTYAGNDPGERAVDPAGVLVVMFNRALKTFTENLMAPLGLQDARIDTFHGWALEAIQRGYRGKLQIDTVSAPGDRTAAELKKHIGMLAAIDAYVLRQTARADAYLRQRLAPYGVLGKSWMQRWSTSNGPLVRRLIRLRTAVLAERNAATGLDAKRLTQVHKLFSAAVSRTILYKEDLLLLLTDAALLRTHLDGVSESDLATLAANQREVSRRGGSARRSGPSIRFSDFALLLRLMQVKNGGLPDGGDESVYRYEHVVIDEVQDFGGVELAVMLDAIEGRTGVTIVGDLNQKIVPSADFVGWDGLAAQLGIEIGEVYELEVGHRSTRPIMALADFLVGEETSPGRAGPVPTFTRVESEDALQAGIAEAVRQSLTERERAHVVVVTRHQVAAAPLADVLAAELEGVCPVRVGHNKTFVFEPGVTVTNYRQIKGLEFDTVILVEPSEAHYPNHLEGKRNLYTTITRAQNRVVLLGVEAPAELLSEAMEAGLLEGSAEHLVPELELEDIDLPL